MERLRQKDKEGGIVERPLTAEQKTTIAEARRVYEAKVAEREILHRDALRHAKSMEELEAQRGVRAGPLSLRPGPRPQDRRDPREPRPSLRVPVAPREPAGARRAPACGL